MDITKANQEGIEFYTVESTGESGMSQSGLSTLAGVSRQALIELETTLVSKAPSKHLESFVGEALTLVTSEDDPIINGVPQGNLKIYKALYCAAVISHYADPDSGGSEQARVVAQRSLVFFAARGMNDWIQGITGWKERRESQLVHTDVYIQRIQNVRDHHIPDNLWTIFRESAELLLLLEKDWRVPINDFDILDGSIGRRWSDYRRGQDWAMPEGTYVHVYRDRRRGRECRAYEYSELPHFRVWLREVYEPEHLPSYLIDKYGKQAVMLVYNENDLLSDRILEMTQITRPTLKQDELYQKFLSDREALSRRLKSGEWQSLSD